MHFATEALRRDCMVCRADAVGFRVVSGTSLRPPKQHEKASNGQRLSLGGDIDFWTSASPDISNSLHGLQ